MNDLSDDQTDQTDDLTPSSGTIPPQQQPYPDSLGKKIPVPEEIINAGKPTDLPRENDSPETLDEALAGESDIEDIDKLNVPAYTGEDDDEKGADVDDNGDDNP
jgi:hypothetical protein